MAGIIAIVKKKKVKPIDITTLDSMMKKIIHRGPDKTQIIISDYFLMSICALKNEDKQNHIWKSQHDSKAFVCDGNIVDKNSNRLNAEKASRIFENEDIDSINSLNGAFAIAGFNKDNFYISRDFIGIKPLYQGYTNEALYLSSELKGIPDFVNRIDIFPPAHFYSKKSGLRKYFDFYKVQPARKLEWSAGTHPRYQFYKDSNPLQRFGFSNRVKEQSEGIENIKKQLSANLEKAVYTNLDFNGKRGEIGALLSGGIDSSIITTILSKKVPELNTFTVGTPESEDLKYARKAAEFLGTNHHEFVYTLDNIIAILDDVIYHLESYEAATVRSAVANYFAAREAAKYVSGIFIGEGGDENFGGYHHLKKQPESLNQNLVNLFQSLHNIGCQRVDRMNMRFSLEAYAPFLNKDLVVLPSLKIPSNLKIYSRSKTEKWILRKTFEDYLPEELIWRAKKQFARGAGFEDVLTKFTENLISDKQFEKEIEQIPNNIVRSKEELFYFKIFKKYFTHPDAIKTVGVWYE